MKIRDIVIGFGFEIDRTSENKANKTIDTLKSASSALETVSIKFETDNASKQNVLDSIDAVKTSTDSIENAIDIAFKTDSSSEQSVISAIDQLKAAAGKLAENITGFAVDGVSEQSVIDAVERLKTEASRLAENTAGFSVNEATEQDVRFSFARLKEEAAVLTAMAVSFAVDNDSAQAVADSMESLKDGAQALENNQVGYKENNSRVLVFSSMEKLKEAAKLLEKNNVGYTIDEASQTIVLDSIGDVKNAAKVLENNKVSFAVDKASEKTAIRSMRRLSMTGRRLLGAIGIGFSLVHIVGRAKSFVAENEEIQGAIGHLRDEWNNWKRNVDETLGITQALTRFAINGLTQLMKIARRVSDVFMRLANRVGGVNRLLRLLAFSAGAIFFALNSKKILSFLRAVSTGLTKVGLKMAAMVAVIVLIALLIDDLINFMQGEDSLLGTLLEKFGIDGDEVRETIRGILDAIKGILPFIIELARSLGSMLLGVLKELLPFLMDLAKAVIPIIVRLLKQIIPIVTDLIRGILPVILNLLQTLLPVVMQIINAVLPVVIRLIETLIAIALPIIDRLLPFLMSLLQSLMPVITFVAELLGNILGAAFEGLMPIINAVMGVFQGLIDFITNVFTGNWRGAWEAIVSIFRNIIDGIVSVFKFPINLIITGINAFLGGLNRIRIPNWVPGVGGRGINIPPIPMLARGSDNAPDTFIAGEEGPELITNAKGSKVFTADETIGIFSKLGGLSQTLRDILSLGVTPKPETVAAATATANVENKSVTQNVDITNTFNGDRAGQQKSAEAMEKAAADATGQLARGLAYAR